jgi:hypothetical protein
VYIGGVRDGEAARLARAVGDGMDDVEDRELDFDVTRHMEGRACLGPLRRLGDRDRTLG